MVRRSTRVLLAIFITFGFIATVSFLYGDSGAAVPKFQTHSSAASEENPALKFKASERSIKEVRNSTLGVCTQLSSPQRATPPLTTCAPTVPEDLCPEPPRPPRQTRWLFLSLRSDGHYRGRHPRSQRPRCRRRHAAVHGRPTDERRTARRRRRLVAVEPELRARSS